MRNKNLYAVILCFAWTYFGLATEPDSEQNKIKEPLIRTALFTPDFDISVHQSLAQSALSPPLLSETGASLLIVLPSDIIIYLLKPLTLKLLWTYSATCSQTRQFLFSADAHQQLIEEKVNAIIKSYDLSYKDITYFYTSSVSYAKHVPAALMEELWFAAKLRNGNAALMLAELEDWDDNRILANKLKLRTYLYELAAALRKPQSRDYWFPEISNERDFIHLNCAYHLIRSYPFNTIPGMALLFNRDLFERAANHLLSIRDCLFFKGPIFDCIVKVLYTGYYNREVNPEVLSIPGIPKQLTRTDEQKKIDVLLIGELFNHAQKLHLMPGVYKGDYSNTDLPYHSKGTAEPVESLSFFIDALWHEDQRAIFIQKGNYKLLPN